MTITTLFDCGQQVFYQNKGKVRSANVSEIKTHTFASRTGLKSKVSYILSDSYSIIRPEDTLYQTEALAQAALEPQPDDIKVENISNI